jgi:hypothetical protein
MSAERLRMIAARETDPKLVAELIRIAEQMDKHSATIERLFVAKPPGRLGDALA